MLRAAESIETVLSYSSGLDFIDLVPIICRSLQISALHPFIAFIAICLSLSHDAV